MSLQKYFFWFELIFTEIQINISRLPYLRVFYDIFVVLAVIRHCVHVLICWCANGPALLETIDLWTKEKEKEYSSFESEAPEEKLERQ